MATAAATFAAFLKTQFTALKTSGSHIAFGIADGNTGGIVDSVGDDYVILSNVDGIGGNVKRAVQFTSITWYDYV